MRFHRGVILAALAALCGCGGGSGDSSSSSGPVFEGAQYRVWTAWIPDTAAADAARADLVASGGNPPVPFWTQVEGGETTKVFDPAAPPASFNAILIQVSAGENYTLDGVEILDDQERVLEHASGILWSNLVDLPADFLGTPDGVGAHTAAVTGSNAFIFTRYSGAIDRFRINARGDAKLPAAGDIKSLGKFAGTVNERPGGLAIDPSGLILVTLTVDKTVHLSRYDLDGALVDDVTLDTGITATAGSHAVALDKDGAIFTAATVAGGQVAVRRHQPNLAEAWKVVFSSGLGGDRVEANGLTMDADGNLVLAGGMNSATGALNHWLARMSGAGAVLLDKRTQIDNSAATHWWGVATGGGGNHLYVTGNQASEILGLIMGKTVRFNTSGVAQWGTEFGGAFGTEDAGRSIALDAAGNLLVAGGFGTPVEGRDAILIRYASTGVPLLAVAYDGAAHGDDEILDIAVDADGSVYAAGYETAAGQGENMWVRKYDANFAPVWTRTHHGGFGNDRAVSVNVHGDQVAVAGFETTSGGKTKFVLRVYAK